MRNGLACAFGASLLAVPVVAQEPQEPAAVSTAPSVALTPAGRAEGCCTLPALTPVSIEILVRINSRLNKIGEHFPIRLAAPIDLGGGRQVRKGVEGSGDIVHAARSGFGGKPGELILAARYLDCSGIRVPLRSLTYAPGRGQDRSGRAFAVAIAGGAPGALVSMFITGGEVNIPAGTVVYAKTAAPVVLSLASVAPTTSPEQTGSLKQ